MLHLVQRHYLYAEQSYQGTPTPDAKQWYSGTARVGGIANSMRSCDFSNAVIYSITSVVCLYFD